MKKLSILLAAALAVAAAIVLNWQPVPFEERAIALQLEHAPAHLAAALRDQPIEVKAAVLDYQDDPLLLLKAEAAVIKYPALARDLLPRYADKPEFKEILRAHGETVLPPIHYFVTHDVATLRFAHAARQKLRTMKVAYRQVANSDAADETAPEITAAYKPQPRPQPQPAVPLTPELRGLYAIEYIHAEGHDFLGQFRMNNEGEAKWIQSERFLEAASRFFTSGIRDLETKYQTDEPITAQDVGWAAVDTLVFASAVKLLRVSRAATASGQAINAPTRTAALSMRIAQTTRLGTRIAHYGKWPAIAVAAYIAIRHPSIISDFLADIATHLGVPVSLALLLGWTLILLPALYLALALLRLIVRPAIALLTLTQRMLSWVDRNKRADAIIGKTLSPSRGWVRLIRGDDF